MVLLLDDSYTICLKDTNAFVSEAMCQARRVFYAECHKYLCWEPCYLLCILRLLVTLLENTILTFIISIIIIVIIIIAVIIISSSIIIIIIIIIIITFIYIIIIITMKRYGKLGLTNQI